MALTELQAQAALQASIATTDPTIDTTQGPIADLFIVPEAGQLSIVSTDAQDLRTLFTLQFPTVATTTEIQLALANYGSAPGGGAFSTTVQYFMSFTVPQQDITIPVGTLVSNIDGSLTFQVLTAGTISAESPASFFNPSRGSYEIGLPVQATGTGSSFDIPAFRINTVVTPIPGIDATENRIASTGGTDSESVTSQANRLQKSLLGINLGAPGGLTNQILNALNSEVTAVQIVQPFEPEFVRITDSPALDIYVIGVADATFSQTIIATANQTQIVLTNVPVISIQSVLINGAADVTGFTLVSDTSPQTGHSLNAVDLLVLDTPLLAGDQVVITYTYNKVLQDVFNQVYTGGQTFLFNTDILIRSPFPVFPQVAGQIMILPSYNVTDVENNLTAYFESIFQFTTFESILLPAVVQQNTIANVPGIQSFNLTQFRRSSGSLSNIEAIEFALNEASVFNSSFINVTVTG